MIGFDAVWVAVGIGVSSCGVPDRSGVSLVGNKGSLAATDQELASSLITITVRYILLTVNHKITVTYNFLADKAPSVYLIDMITADQIRAARALLNWKQTDLAAASGVSEMSVKNLEKGQTDPRISTLRAIEDAFIAAGIEFINDSQREGAAKLRK
nr:helix-turn-helix transcriptional regulator [Brucella intermedia]